MPSPRDNEIATFISKINSLLDHHHELKLAIHNKRNEASLESELVVQLALSITVLWESFIHDLIIAYIMIDPSRLWESLEQRVRNSISSKFGPATYKCIEFKSLSTLSRIKIQELIDFKGLNITANNAIELSTKANNLLISRYAMRFSLGSEDAEFYNYSNSLRNYLSHFSAGARKIFKGNVDGISSNKNAQLKDALRKIEPYLKANIGGNKTRIEFIASRYLDIANIL